MKRRIQLLALSVMLVLVTVCAASCSDGATASISDADSEGLLPTRIEQLSSGGVVPEGSEPIEGEEGAYPIESLWGEWVLADENVEVEQTVHTKTPSYVNEEGETEGGLDIEIKVFPQKIYFLPWWVENKIYMSSLTLSNSYYDVSSLLIDSSTDLGNVDITEDTTYEDTLLGAALRKWSCCPGNATFDYNEYRLAYRISGNTLALGLLSTESEDLDELDITEIDYEISFSGYQLTLTYGDESVTYIPSGWEESQTNELYFSGPEQGYEEMDNILGITLRNYQKVMLDCNDGYVDATYDFQDDGVLTIETENGDRLQYTYLLSELTITLISNDKVSVYSVYQLSGEAPNWNPQRYCSSDWDEPDGPTLEIDGEATTFSPKNPYRVCWMKGIPCHWIPAS